MFTIDLLKGQGIPTKSKPESMAIAAIGFAVPVIATLVVFGCYLHSSVVISIQKQRILNYETKTAELANAIKLQKSFEQEEGAINTCLSEVSSSTNRHFQWSPVLATLVTNMPDSVILTRLEAKQNSVKIKVPQKNDPKKMIDISVPARTLQLSVSGYPQYNIDKAVRDLRDRLRFSTLLESKLEDIRVSQGFSTLEGQDVVSYEVDCIFKSPL